MKSNTNFGDSSKTLAENFGISGKDIFDYLTASNVLKYYSIENEHDLKLLTADYNRFANVDISEKTFQKSAKIIASCCFTPLFSYFRKPVSNVFPYKNVGLKQLYEVIKQERFFKKQTDNLRQISEKHQKQTYKSKNFDYVTFCGTFTKRNAHSLVKHSGLLCIDFDNVGNVSDLKTKLLSDKLIETQMLFVSPSGNGLKWIISFDNEKFSQIIYFEGIKSYIKQTYCVQIDESCKDISRACYVCHDENVFINHKYLTL